MADAFLQTTSRFIADHQMIHHQETVLVAVSGGADSLALLHVLSDLSQQFRFHLQIAHNNHGLRPNATSEADFVAQKARELNLPLVVEQMPDPALLTFNFSSMEANLRQMRYQFLNRVADQVKADKIALGHQTDDQAETILLKLLRGAGGSGLGGILPVRDDRYIRPLLCHSRSAIESYLNYRGMIACHDESNTDLKFLRNRVRHQLIPDLKQNYNPQIQSTLNRTADLLQNDEDFIQQQTQQAAEECQITPHQFDRQKFLDHHVAIQRRILRYVYTDIVGQTVDLYFSHVASMLDLLHGHRPNTELSLPHQVQFQRAYDQFSFTPVPDPPKRFELQLQIDDRTQFPVGIITSQIFDRSDEPMPNGKTEAIFDLDRIQLPLWIRTRRNGDRFYPFGMTGSKKIKDFLIDQKVAKNRRDGVPIVVDNAQHILWIIGYRTSQIGQITDTTQRVLKIQYAPHCSDSSTADSASN